MPTETLSMLFDALNEDQWRKEHPFSQDIEDANAVMHHPFVDETEIAEVLRRWCMKKQPCNFGRIAAKYGFIHFCVVTERDLRQDEDALRKKIAEEKQLWKQRAVTDRNNPPHSFMLLVASSRVALAAPNDSLRRFSTHIRDLAGWTPVEEEVAGSSVSSDLLYLRNPTDDLYYGYQFNVDFFAAAGDGRWWHDHRVPGGIAFTANSTGHMRHWQEWYSKAEDPQRGEWFVKNAMYTIAQSHPTKPRIPHDSHASGTATESIPEVGLADPAGRVTWLRDLDDGTPLRRNVACPFKSGVPKRLEGKDWTTYEGVIHTDHAVREEFFDGRPAPRTATKPYYMDFTYLYEKREPDFIRFMAGIRLSEGDVTAKIGSPETWRYRSATSLARRSAGDSDEIARLMAVTENWSLSQDLISESPTL